MLIVSHTFPPDAGVGGRRWAKFAKYFQKSGVKVQVVAADLKTKNISPWKDDVENIPVIRYRGRFPSALTLKPTRLLQKLSYRLQLIRMRLLTKGTPYDRAILDKEAFLDAFKRGMETSPQTVVVTGAPFSLLVYVAECIHRYPNTFFIADFRDPWTWGDSYGYLSLENSRISYEEENERKVIQAFNQIYSPWPEIVGKLQVKYPEKAASIGLLAHGYDPDDFPEKTERTSDDKIRMVYGGAIYSSALPALRLLADFVGEHADKLRLDIYSSEKSKLRGLPDGVEVHDPLPVKAFFGELLSADWLLFLIPDVAKNGVTTKTYEFASTGKPILAMGAKGALSDFVQSTGIGIFARGKEDLKVLFDKSFQRAKTGDWLLEHRYDILAENFLKASKARES